MTVTLRPAFRVFNIGIGTALLSGLALLAMTAPSAAQNVTIGFGEGAALTERTVQIIALITILSLAPSILVMVTSFTRIVVVLSLLRTAIGVQQSPPNTVVISLALFLTAFVMGPIFQQAYDAGIKPLIANEIEIG
ncbi:MAG TPA: flagellar biosynthetic protein FliP, partial [Rhizobiales bacterium]|nr:flagellar biosynthetic protein FliP [Hyphomicrobiales bacterium]